LNELINLNYIRKNSLRANSSCTFNGYISNLQSLDGYILNFKWIIVIIIKYLKSDTSILQLGINHPISMDLLCIGTVSFVVFFSPRSGALCIRTVRSTINDSDLIIINPHASKFIFKLSHNHSD
jgi:hypothetical protein